MSVNLGSVIKERKTDPFCFNQKFYFLVFHIEEMRIQMHSYQKATFYHPKKYSDYISKHNYIKGELHP